MSPPSSWRVPTVFALLALTFLVGCTAIGPAGDTSETSSAIEIPWPREEAHYAYEDARGRGLEVSIGEWVQRKDAWLNDRTGLALEVRHEGDEHWFDAEVTVLPRTGGILQQWSPCAAWDLQEPSECASEAHEAYTGAQGLPGGLGEAPFWGETLDEGTVRVDLATPLPGNENWTYEVSEPPRPTSWGSCLSLDPVDGVDRASLAALSFTAAPETLTVCENLVLPAAFTSFGGARYQLRDVERGEEAVSLPSEDELPRDPEPPVGFAEQTFPVYAAQPTVETNFTATEAHEVAKERSETYSSLFAADENTTVVSSHWNHQSSRQSGLPGGPSSRTEGQRLIAVDDKGRWADVKLTKTIEDTGSLVERETTYDVDSEEEGGSLEPTPTRDSLASQGARLDDVRELGEQLTGQPPDEGAGFGRWRSLPTHGHVESLSGWRLHGSSVVSWHEDAHPKSSGGLLIETPYSLAVDGSTGSVIRVYTEPSVLNETMR